ncbi:hypothetical protein [Streptomyces sp. NPDC001340]
MTRTQVGQAMATLVIAVLMAALPASTPGTTTVEAKADGPGPCCKIIGQDVLPG